MKILYLLPLTFFYFGCQPVKNNPSPTQNSVLNSITKSTAAKEREGLLQEGVTKLSGTIRENISASDSIKEKESMPEVEKEKKGFLQQMIDDLEHNRSETDQTSRVKELESMPVIGK